jgi:hypothetical protein
MENIMTKLLYFPFIILSIFSLALGQNGDSIPTSSTTFGLELDALPYISSGYYGSVWYGADHFRIRGVVTKTTVPEFILPEGFKNNRLKVFAFIVDYFPQLEFRGWWIGSGLEIWNATIEHKNENSAPSYTNTVFTVGGGYVWKFYRNFYLNPWAAAHIIIAGDKDVAVGLHAFKPSVFTGEVSLKIGWHL